MNNKIITILQKINSNPKRIKNYFNNNLYISIMISITKNIDDSLLDFMREAKILNSIRHVSRNL